ncbi:hypothetical protein Ga0100231_024055 [Opitutaceae bacterium TAV4]|nr:hypothetical protein Ga0100231_024055 [Opitutaceae bacterium TAV4]RRK00786.1 hypothetical protein Ga0100230_023630 [Opitutaceae bacterium TAV3]
MPDTTPTADVNVTAALPVTASGNISPPSPPPVSYREIIRRIDAMMAGRAEDGVKSYQINNRRLDRYSITELLELRRYYAKLAAQQEAPRNRLGGRRIACYL